jgi:hypothetical protein
LLTQNRGPRTSRGSPAASTSSPLAGPAARPGPGPPGPSHSPLQRGRRHRPSEAQPALVSQIMETPARPDSDASDSDHDAAAWPGAWLTGNHAMIIMTQVVPRSRRVGRAVARGPYVARGHRDLKAGPWQQKPGGCQSRSRCPAVTESNRLPVSGPGCQSKVACCEAASSGRGRSESLAESESSPLLLVFMIHD